MKWYQTILAFLKVSIKNSFVYRGMMLVWIFGYILTFISMLYLWQAVQSKDNLIAGFTSNQLTTYYFLGTLVWAISGWFCFDWTSQLIKNGNIFIYFLKPFNFYFYVLGSELGWHLLSTFFSFFFLSILYFCFRNAIIINLNFFDVVLFFLSLIFSALLIFTIQLFLMSLVFWTINYQGLNAFFWLSYSLLGGEILPLNFLPVFIKKFIKILPFRFMYSFPLEIYLKQVRQQEIFFSFSLAFIWLIFFYFLYNLLFKLGAKKYSGVSQ